MRVFIWVYLALLGCVVLVELMGTMHAAWRFALGLASGHEVDRKVDRLALVCVLVVVNLVIARSLLGK